jgi:2-phospho-L-lactate guanylyltransferase (CobY/MobA/RfbA family)
MGNAFVEYDNVFPLLAPLDIAGTATATPYVDLKTAHDATIFVYVGAITTASADQTAGPVITIEAALTGASASTEVNYEFKYRLSAAIGTNTWAAISTASAGVDLTVTGDGKMLAIHIDPAAVQEALANARFVRAVITPGTGGATCLVAAWAVIRPRYKMTTMVSAAA